jgi:hypothetical protein
VDEVSTQTVRLVAQKVNLPTTRDNIARMAQILELRVDAVEEEPRRVGTELTITLTGPAGQIEALRAQMGGRGFSSGPNGGLLDSFIGGLLDDSFQALQRWRRSHFRRGSGI